MFLYGNFSPAVWKCMAFFSFDARSPLSTAAAASLTSGIARESILRVRTPGANCPRSPTTSQMELPCLPERSRFITTVPTAIMPALLERLDSKYMALSRHSLSRDEYPWVRVLREGDPPMLETDMLSVPVWLQPASAN